MVGGRRGRIYGSKSALLGTRRRLNLYQRGLVFARVMAGMPSCKIFRGNDE